MRPRYRKIFILISFLLILLLLSNIFAFSDKNYKPKYGITTANLNFRFTPSLSSRTIIKTLKKGTTVKIVGEINNFYITQIGTNEVGLVSKNYIKSTSSAPAGAKVYTNLRSFYATTDVEGTILRAGPSTYFKARASLYKGVKVQVIGEIDNFYMVVTQNNYVGMIRKDLLTKISSNETTTTNPTTPSTPSTPTTPSTPSTDMTPGVQGSANEELILKLLNQARSAKGLKPLIMDADLLRIARIKAEDMVNSNYFSHTSPLYGSPFNMMKNNGITYKSAGENIAGNPSLQDAVTAWLNSPGHSKNIYSTAYQYIGIGVAKSSVYGYVISTMFIQK